jgi:hypothetical protein
MEIMLTKGMFALVDEVDAMYAGFNWHVAAEKYAARSARVNGKKSLIYLHRVLLGAKPGQIVDHINGNTLDNRRSNLRFVTKGQNNANRHKRLSKTSYLGVCVTRGGKFRAGHHENGKFKQIGVFDTPKEAAIRRDQYIKENNFIYTSLNFPCREN